MKSINHELKFCTHMKSLCRILIPSLFVTLLITGCSEDFLERPPLSEISADNFYQTPEELRLATAALYAGAPWGEWTYTGYLPIGEVMSGNMALGWNGDAIQFNAFAVTESNEGLMATWKSMFKVIAHCNTTINAIQEKAPATISDQDKNAAIAEARFIRGYAYYNLAMMWKDVPIIEDNTSLISTPLVYRNNVDDVYQFVVNDLTFAAEHLPLTDKGRVTTWSAQGMLAKVYLTWAGLKSQSVGQRDEQLLGLAKLYAGNVCNQSGLELFENYADLFKTQFNDNPESLFALQWHGSTSDWLSGNMLQIYASGGTAISPNGDAGWFGITPTYDMYKQYSTKDSLRRKATFMLKGDYYPELNAAGGGFTYNGDAGLKKHIVGTRADNSSPTMTLTSSPQHNSLLRLADVYLLYAEAILGNNTTTSDGEAIKYFNLVRERAGLAQLDPKVDVLHADSLFKERRIELAAESQFWFDVVRLSYYDRQEAINILNNQQRVPFTYEDGVATPGDPYGEITSAAEGTFRFPLPASEVTANPKLSEPPVPYSFE
jgi:hypothetical protein